jgi:hypothetical protein
MSLTVLLPEPIKPKTLRKNYDSWRRGTRRNGHDNYVAWTLVRLGAAGADRWVEDHSTEGKVQRTTSYPLTLR